MQMRKNEQMTSRKRILHALAHKETDKIPVDFGSTRATGINALAYYQLKKYLNLPGIVKVYDVKQLLADPDAEILQLMYSDCIQLHRLSPCIGVKLDKWKKTILMDGNEYAVPANFSPVKLEDGSMGILDADGRVLLKRPEAGLYFDDVYNPLANAAKEQDIDRFLYPAVSEEEIAFVSFTAKDLFEKTEDAVIFSTGISLFEKGIKDFGYEEFLVKIYTEQDLVIRYLENLTEAYLKIVDKYAASIGGYVQVFQLNDDLGMQQSTILQPDIYRKVFKPFHRRIFQYIKKQIPGIYTLLHSCGSIYDLIPDLIDVGVDSINPVQINAAKMDPATLKREFGKDITFWGGGCSTQTTLTFGSLQEIKDEVKRMIDIFAPGGGFIFNQVHNIQANISPEKILALYGGVT